MFKRRKPKLLSDEELNAKLDSFEFEKGDRLALFLAAMKVFLPGILIMLIIYMGILWIIFT